MRLRLSDQGIGGGPYRSGAVPDPWLPGEVREVDEAIGAYLLREFSGLFYLVPVAPVMGSAPAALDRKVRAPGKRGKLNT